MVEVGRVGVVVVPVGVVAEGVVVVPGEIVAWAVFAIGLAVEAGLAATSVLMNERKMKMEETQQENTDKNGVAYVRCPTENPLFRFHKLNEEGQTKAIRIAQIFDDLYHELERSGVVAGRAWGVAQQKLEEALFFAKKSMAEDKNNQETA